jgi:hypothetical protein
MQDRGDLHRGPLTTAGGSDTASIEASCNAAIAKKFLTDILANGPVVPFAPRANDPETTYSPQRPFCSEIQGVSLSASARPTYRSALVAGE